MNHSRILSLLLIGLSVLTITAEARSRVCRLVYPERPQSAPKMAHIFDGSTSQPVYLPSMNFSEVIALPGGEITLVMTLNQISDPKAVPAKAPRLRIPENTRDFYIILTDDPENQEIPVRMNLVSTDNGKLKVGETLWFNLTGHRIVAKLGDTDMSVDPNGKTVSKSPVSASSYYAARFAYQADGKGPLAPITEQNWWHDVASRHMGFIAYTGGKLPKIYFYRDYRDPLAERQSVEVVQEPSPP